MNEFGDFANIDVDKLLNGAQERVAKMQEMRERISELVGYAQDEEGMVKVTYTAAGGLDQLELNPRAMRLASQDLSERIRTAVREAAEDLQRKMREVTQETFGDRPDLRDPEVAMEQAKEAQAAFDRTLKDAVGELDRIRKRMGL